MNIFQTRIEQRKKVLNLKKIYDLDKAIAKIVDHAEWMTLVFKSLLDDGEGFEGKRLSKSFP